jgi:hypothetical protein
MNLIWMRAKEKEQYGFIQSSPKLFSMFILLCRLLLSEGNTEVTSSALLKSRKPTSMASRIGNATSAQNVLQIFETEELDGKNWINHKNRWSNSDGEECEAPPSIESPPGYQFDGDWKIVTSTNRDSLGWEYIWSPHQPAIRRRVWLRALTISAAVAPKLPPSPTVRLPSINIVALRDQWNFKGFGLSVYKSLTFAKSFGVALRLPIMSNIEWWERHPELPSFSTAVAGYFPWMAVYQISGSFNVDFLAWAMGRSCRYALYGFSFLVLSICQFLFLPFAILLYPMSRKILFPSFSLPSVPTDPPIFSLKISQRIGMSLNWRMSWPTGYDFRVSYYYECMPALLYLIELIHRNRKEFSDTTFTKWLRRKAAALGCSCGVPLPIPPHFFCTAALGLNGFYFKLPKSQQQLKQSQQQQSRSNLSTENHINPIQGTAVDTEASLDSRKLTSVMA